MTARAGSRWLLAALTAMLLVIIATWIVGWWGVIVAGALTGAGWRNAHRVSLAAAAGGAAAWGVLLARDMAAPATRSLAGDLAGIFHLPVAVLLLVSLLLPALLAGSAAALAHLAAGP